MRSVLEPGQRASSSGVWRGFFGRRFFVFLILFVAEVIVFFALPAIPFASGEKDSYTQQAKQLGGVLNSSFVGQIAAIYVNNMKVGLIELVPGLGPLFFGLSLYETARVIQVIAPSGFPPVLLVITLFLLPHSWIELPVYALATGESILLLYSLMMWLLRGERWRLRMELEQLLLVILVISVTLLVGAVFEVTEIALGAAGLLMWGPFGALAAAVLLFRRRVRRPEQVVVPAPQA